ncbi:MAG: B12-binding domain-containing radical SAM protein [Chloroflexi bacterium]|nr:B12-binding domain-containing radical SAM protein [Chloroflexota bacterium]
MASVLLIYPYFHNPRKKTIFRFPPLGIGYIAAALRKAGHEVQILDCTFMKLESALEAARKAKADIIGISSMMTLREESLDFARCLRSCCDLLVAGGPLPSLVPDAFIQDFDVVVLGEGEQAMLEIATAYEQGGDFSSIPGIVYRKGNGEVLKTASRQLTQHLDAIPFPARHLLPNKDYIDFYRRRFGNATTSIITTRGCPFSCEFCSNAVFSSSYRERSAQNVVDEVEQALSLGYDRIHFADDVFTLRRGRVLEVCQEVKARGLKFTWECLGRVDSVDPELASAMKDAGCDRIFFGIESGNNSILKLMDKKITVEKARQAVAAAHNAGIRVGAFFILCYPGETPDTVLNTLRFAISLPLDYLSFTVPYPMPGTALYERVKDRMTREWRQDSHITDHSLTFDADFSEARMRFAILKGQAQYGIKKRLGRYAKPLLKPFEATTDLIFRIMR